MAYTAPSPLPARSTLLPLLHLHPQSMLRRSPQRNPPPLLVTHSSNRILHHVGRDHLRPLRINQPGNKWYRMCIQCRGPDLIAEDPLPALAVSCEVLVNFAEESRSLGLGALDCVGGEGIG